VNPQLLSESPIYALLNSIHKSEGDCPTCDLFRIRLTSLVTLTDRILSANLDSPFN
jgi:hypothetical protein